MLQQCICIGFVLATIVSIPQVVAGSSMDSLQVACVQLKPYETINQNARAIVKALESESEAGTRLVVFPECALTGYEPKIIPTLKQEDIDRGVDIIRRGCRKFDIYAVVGSAYKENDKWYNVAYVIGPQGQIVKRYAKLHVVMPKIFVNGDELAIFYIDDVPATIMICHDERYPEIMRIPVLAGAKLGIYISCESKTEKKRDSYRCQIIARAVENQISMIHCNSGDCGTECGSHGHSRIIDPTGKVLAEASDKVGEVIRATVKPKASSNGYARKGAATASLQKFWAEGLRVLKEQNPEFFSKTTTKADHLRK
ncbi:MAG: nitrilase-related carbon-nitrogen hydrolase [Planctomycetota bacterium]|jgi:predicted amidohydrolase